MIGIFELFCSFIPSLTLCRWDEWVDDSRILKYNDENKEIQTQIRAEYRRNKNSKRKDRKGTAFLSFSFHKLMVHYLDANAKPGKKKKELGFGSLEPVCIMVATQQNNNEQ